MHERGIAIGGYSHSSAGHSSAVHSSAVDFQIKESNFMTLQYPVLAQGLKRVFAFAFAFA